MAVTSSSPWLANRACSNSRRSLCLDDADVDSKAGDGDDGEEETDGSDVSSSSPGLPTVPPATVGEIVSVCVADGDGDDDDDDDDDDV